MTVRAVLYLLMLFVATMWYGTRAIVASLLRVRYRPGGVYDTTGRAWARVVLRAAGVTVTVEGAEHLAPVGPQIIASNHQSFFDILAILADLPVPVKFVAKKELFGIPVFGPALKAVGHIRLDRRNIKEAFAVYATAAKELVERRLTLHIFPEGTRTRTGEPLPFKRGPFVLAIESGAPIVPAYVAGTFGILPKGSIIVRPHPVTIHLAPPIATAGLSTEDRDVLATRVREAVLVLRAKSVDASPRPA